MKWTHTQYRSEQTYEFELLLIISYARNKINFYFLTYTSVQQWPKLLKQYWLISILANFDLVLPKKKIIIYLIKKKQNEKGIGEKKERSIGKSFKGIWIDTS